MRFLLLISAAALLISTAAQATFSPANPGASGYVLVFDDEFTTLSTIDVNNTGNPGYNWCVLPWSGAAFPAADYAIGAGGLTISPTSPDVSNAQLATACTNTSSQGYVGTVFARGWYAEVAISFNSALSTTSGFPAFWFFSANHGLSIRKGVANYDHWSGQAAGYEHYIEPDVFEYDNNGTVTTWAQTIHDWYGLYNVTCSPYCNDANHDVVTSGGVVWTSVNTVGELYIPGSASNGYQGSMQAYFNGAAVGTTVTWTDNAPGTPPPTGTFQWSWIDNDLFNLVLGTGYEVPITVRYVRVWQLNAPLNVPMLWFH